MSAIFHYTRKREIKQSMFKRKNCFSFYLAEIHSRLVPARNDITKAQRKRRGSESGESRYLKRILETDQMTEQWIKDFRNV